MNSDIKHFLTAVTIVILSVIIILLYSCTYIGKSIDITLMATTPYFGSWCEDIGEIVDDNVEMKDWTSKKAETKDQSQLDLQCGDIQDFKLKHDCMWEYEERTR